nr:L-type lectin-domain containing receptor kinase VII.1-like [Arachis hypogaea]
MNYSLQYLASKFAAYLKLCGDGSIWTITGPDSNVEKNVFFFHLLKSGGRGGEWKFGVGWRECCRIYNLKEASWDSPKLTRSCSNLERRDVLGNTIHQFPDSKSQSFENLQELTAGKVAANLESPRSVMTHCSADRVMLRRHSSSQVLPSGSKRFWWKMFVWSHRNIHRPISSKSTQVNPGVAVTHNPYGYSSDTLEPKHKQSPGNVECEVVLFSYNIESLRLECFIKCKGVLRGSAEVAVKRISQENDGVREFLAEISSLGRLKQRNLVALRGWCKKDMGNFLLVYEYMDKRVFCDESMMLNCEERIRIIKGVAFAVLYLHEGWEEQVLHRDIKASNVLLDKDMNGKLGDFGLARMNSHGQVASTTKLVGTVGYMAPEVIKTGQASTRTDVYMFGILILEVMCGRRPMDEGKPPLVEFVWGLMVKGELMNALDERLSAKGDFNLQQVEKVLQLGLLCAYPEPKSRPNMRQVVSILEGNNEGGEESENENADTCLLLKLKSGDIFSEYSNYFSYSTHPTFEDIRQSNTSSMSLTWSKSVVEGR